MPRPGQAAPLRLGVVWLGVVWLGVVCLGGCRHGSGLPADIADAQRLEARKEGAAALRAYHRAGQGCRPGARPRDECGLIAFREAQILERLDQPAEAAAAFLRVREQTTDGRVSARALLRAATLQAEVLGRPEEALRLCRLIVRRWPDEIAAEEALRLLVRLRGEDPTLDAELDELAQALRAHEVSGFALLYRADRAALVAEAGGPDAGVAAQVAVARYDELWQRFPRGPLRDDAAYRAAVLLRHRGEPQQAVRRLKALIATYRSSLILGHYNLLQLDDAALLLGEIYLQDLHQPAEALAAFAGLVKRQPNSLLADDALLLMARSALARHEPPQQADRDEACRHLKALRKRYPASNQTRKAVAEEQRLGCH